MEKRIAIGIAAAALILLNGCAGTRTQARMLTGDGTIRIEPSDDPAYNYKFSIKTVWDAGMDTNRQEDRLTLIRNLVGDDCDTPKIVDEQFLRLASGPMGGERGIWVSKVKCSVKSQMIRR